MSDDGTDDVPKSNAGEPAPGSSPGSNPGSRPGSNPGSNHGSNPGSNHGSTPGSGTGPGSTPGSNPGAPPGSNPGSGSNHGSNPGAPPGSNSGSTPGSNPGAPPGSNPGAGPPGSSPGSKHGSTPGSNSGSGSHAPDQDGPSNAPPSSGPAPPSSKAGSKHSGGGGGGPSPGGRRKRGDKPDLSNCRIGFIGAGKMAEAITSGLVHFTKIEPNRIFVASKSGRTLDTFKQMGCTVTKRSYDIFAKLDCDIVFIVVHGHVIRQLYKAGGTRPLALTTNYIPNQRHPVFLLSLVGGIPLNDIKNTLLNPDHPEKYKIMMHRIMLNTSVAYGLGLGALDMEPDSKKCNPLIRDMLTSFAKLEYIQGEANIDVTCAIGGNGLAFVYYFITALSDGGVKMGLPKNVAIKMATKTLQSAAACLLESGKNPAELRDSCTSPSGPAIYGIHMLDQKEAGHGIAAAVEGAFKRIRELVDTTGNMQAA